MRRQSLISVAICVGVLASLCSAAGAQETNAPPGNSGIDQYLETVPEAGGNRPAQDRNASELSARTLRSLKAAGPDGEAIVNLEASSGSATPKNRSARSNSERKAARLQRSDTAEQPRKVPATVAAPTLGGSGEGGVGILLPLFLGLSAVAAMLFVLYRRRSR